MLIYAVPPFPLTTKAAACGLQGALLTQVLFLSVGALLHQAEDSGTVQEFCYHIWKSTGIWLFVTFKTYHPHAKTY